MKSIQFPALQFLFVGLAVSIFFACGKTQNRYAALPENTAILLEINSLKQLDSLFSKTAHPLAQAFGEMTFAQQLRRDTEVFQKIFTQKTAAKTSEKTAAADSQFSNCPTLAALTLNDSEQHPALFVVEAQHDFDLENLLKNSAVAPKIFPSNFKGKEIFTIELAENQRFGIAQHGRLLLFSSQPYLVEDALVAADGGKNLWSNSDFQKVATGGGEAAVFLNFEKIASQTASDFQPDFRSFLPLVAENLAWLKFSFSKNEVHAAAATGDFLAKNEFGKAEREAVFAVLPENTAAFAWAGFSNHRPFFSKFEFGQAADFQKFTASWLGDEVCWAMSEPFSTDLREEQFYLLAVRDSAHAEQRLDEFAAERGILKNYDYQTFRVRQFFSPALLEPLLRDDAEGFEKPVVARLGGFLVCTSTTTAMEVLIDKFIVNQTLANASDFLQLKKQMPTTGQAAFFLHSKYLPAIVERLLKNSKTASANARAMSNSGLLALDFSEKNEVKFFQQKTSDALAQTGILWKTELGAAVATQPCIVPKLGGDTGGAVAGIFVQDTRNQLYCLLPNGEILWKRYLDGRLAGQVFPIDFFENGTTCFLFNTPEKIYLLDPEGKDVERYPIALKSRATNTLTLVSFRQSNDCGYFLCCENGNAYGFDRLGRPLGGWNPQSGVGEVRQPILHFLHEKKDFLVLLSRSGRLSVFGRNGDSRFPVQQISGSFELPPQADFLSKSPRIVAANREGKVFAVNLAGEAFSLSAGGREGFVFAQILDDSRADYASLAGDQLQVKGYRGGAFETFFSKKFPCPQDTLFEVRMLRPASLLGSWSRSRRQIFLVSGRGALLPDFPLAGSTPFSVGCFSGDRNVWALVVGLDSRVYAYSIR